MQMLAGYSLVMQADTCCRPCFEGCDHDSPDQIFFVRSFLSPAAISSSYASENA